MDPLFIWKFTHCLKCLWICFAWIRWYIYWKISIKRFTFHWIYRCIRLPSTLIHNLSMNRRYFKIFEGVSVVWGRQLFRNSKLEYVPEILIRIEFEDSKSRQHYFQFILEIVKFVCVSISLNYIWNCLCSMCEWQPYHERSICLNASIRLHEAAHLHKYLLFEMFTFYAYIYTPNNGVSINIVHFGGNSHSHRRKQFNALQLTVKNARIH